MQTFYDKYRNPGKYSQCGEEGIINEALRRINPTEKTAVEFGAPDWTYCSNTAHLAELGWSVRMYDFQPHDPRVEKIEITTENINQVVGNPTVLSIDCDGPDAILWEAYEGTPAIVVIEIDSSLKPSMYQQPAKHNGPSYPVMVELGIKKGYFLLCHTGNCVFILNKYRDLFPEIIGDGLENSELYFNKSHVR